MTVFLWHFVSISFCGYFCHFQIGITFISYSHYSNRKKIRTMHMQCVCVCVFKCFYFSYCLENTGYMTVGKVRAIFNVKKKYRRYLKWRNKRKNNNSNSNTYRIYHVYTVKRMERERERVCVCVRKRVGHRSHKRKSDMIVKCLPSYLIKITLVKWLVKHTGMLNKAWNVKFIVVVCVGYWCSYICK